MKVLTSSIVAIARSAFRSARLAAGHIMHLANSNRPTGKIMRKFSAVTIMAILASATLVNSAFCASARWSKIPSVYPPYQYGWWDRDQWRGGWGPA